jgi:hypothetical protein
MITAARRYFFTSRHSVFGSKCRRFVPLPCGFKGRHNGLSRTSSEVFNTVRHLIGFINLPDENESIDDLADTPRVFLAVGDAGMGDAGGMDAEKVSILGEDNPALGEGIGRLLLVGSRATLPPGSSLRRCRDDEAPWRWPGAVLIQVEADRLWHWPCVP